MRRTFAAELAAIRAGPLYRRLPANDGGGGVEVEFDGRRVVRFAANDYLGLAGSELLVGAAAAALAAHGVGSGAARLIGGTRAPHRRLEEQLAEFKGAAAALTFASGYAAAIGAVGALVGRGDVIIMDKLCHASLVDGARLSGATIRVFPHQHLDKLARLLAWSERQCPTGRVMVITESVFSMDGDRAPLREIVGLKDRHGAVLLVDEAHAVGVIGPHGRGLADELGVAGAVDVAMGTLSKALGAAGGYLCGSGELIELLVNRARSFIYTTAPPAACAAAAGAAIAHLQTAAGEACRRRLWENIRHLAAVIPSSARPAAAGESAIFPLPVGDETAATACSRALFERGFYVPAIRYPTVARGAARLRVTVSAAHSPAQIAALGEALAAVLGPHPASHPDPSRQSSGE